VFVHFLEQQPSQSFQCLCVTTRVLCTSIQYKNRGTHFRQGIAKSILVCRLLQSSIAFEVQYRTCTFRYRLDPSRYHSMTGVCIHAGGGRHGPDVNRKSMKNDPVNWFVHIRLHVGLVASCHDPAATNVPRIKATSAAQGSLPCIARPTPTSPFRQVLPPTWTTSALSRIVS
jgi:hypothetical protein